MAQRFTFLFFTLIIGFSAFSSSLPEKSTILPGYEKDSVINRMRQLPLHHIEGLWQFTENGATIAIERSNKGKHPNDGLNRYNIVIVSSPRLSIKPGTIMGHITPTAKQDIYDAQIYTDFDGGTTLSIAKRFILTLNDDSRLAFSRDKSGLRINIRKLLPYMFRYTITYQNERPKNIDGCIRIFPKSSNSPIEPRYL